MTVAGLGYAIQHLRQNSRYPDTELAHISPEEIKLFDAIQGRKIRNPKTGLPEYGLLGDILQAALGVGGFMVGGPLGAAAGSGIGSAINGGNLTQDLTAAALGGAGGELGQGLTGGGWNPLGGSLGGAAGAAGAAGVPSVAGAQTFGSGAGAITATPLGGAPLSTALGGTAAAVPAASPGGLAGLVSHIGGYGGLGAGLGALSGMPTSVPQTAPLQPLPQNTAHLSVPSVPNSPWQYVNGQWQYMPMNNAQSSTTPTVMAKGGVVHKAAGGTSIGSPLPLHRLRALSRYGFSNMMADGGSTHNGPVEGHGSGRDDKIPAMLSDGEHVWSARDVSAFGEGSNAEGQRRLYRLRKMVEDHAGFKPSEHLKAPRKMPSDGALLKKAKAS